MVRACSGAPVPPCRARCPSPLTPGCREPVQFHRDPPRSFGTCMWYRYPTPNRKHKSAAGHRPADRAAGDPGRMSAKPQKHRNEETDCHLGTCLPGSQAEISLSRKGNLLQRVRLKLTRHWTAARISPLQHCLSQPRPTQHTEPEKQLSGSCFSNSHPILGLQWHSTGSSATAKVFPTEHTLLSQEREHGNVVPRARTGEKAVFFQ